MTEHTHEYDFAIAKQLYDKCPRMYAYYSVRDLGPFANYLDTPSPLFYGHERTWSYVQQFPKEFGVLHLRA